MYRYYNPNPRGNVTAGDCVIRAITKADKIDWATVYTALCVYGMKYGDWGNSNAAWDAYLRDQGYKRKIIPNTCPSCYTVGDFAREHPSGTYIAATGRHAVAVVNGDWFDSWNSRNEIPMYYYTKEE